MTAMKMLGGRLAGRLSRLSSRRHCSSGTSAQFLSVLRDASSPASALNAARLRIEGLGSQAILAALERVVALRRPEDQFASDPSVGMLLARLQAQVVSAAGTDEELAPADAVRLVGALAHLGLTEADSALGANTCTTLEGLTNDLNRVLLPSLCVAMRAQLLEPTVAVELCSYMFTGCRAPRHIGQDTQRQTVEAAIWDAVDAAPREFVHRAIHESSLAQLLPFLRGLSSLEGGLPSGSGKQSQSHWKTLLASAAAGEADFGPLHFQQKLAALNGSDFSAVFEHTLRLQEESEGDLFFVTLLHHFAHHVTTQQQATLQQAGSTTVPCLGAADLSALLHAIARCEPLVWGDVVRRSVLADSTMHRNTVSLDLCALVDKAMANAFKHSTSDAVSLTLWSCSQLGYSPVMLLSCVASASARDDWLLPDLSFCINAALACTDPSAMDQHTVQLAATTLSKPSTVSLPLMRPLTGQPASRYASREILRVERAIREFEKGKMYSVLDDHTKHLLTLIGYDGCVQILDDCESQQDMQTQHLQTLLETFRSHAFRMLSLNLADGRFFTPAPALKLGKILTQNFSSAAVKANFGKLASQQAVVRRIDLALFQHATASDFVAPRDFLRALYALNVTGGQTGGGASRALLHAAGNHILARRDHYLSCPRSAMDVLWPFHSFYLASLFEAVAGVVVPSEESSFETVTSAQLASASWACTRASQTNEVALDSAVDRMRREALAHLSARVEQLNQGDVALLCNDGGWAGGGGRNRGVLNLDEIFNAELPGDINGRTLALALQACVVMENPPDSLLKSVVTLLERDINLVATMHPTQLTDIMLSLNRLVTNTEFNGIVPIFRDAVLNNLRDYTGVHLRIVMAFLDPRDFEQEVIKMVNGRTSSDNWDHVAFVLFHLAHDCSYAPSAAWQAVYTTHLQPRFSGKIKLSNLSDTGLGLLTAAAGRARVLVIAAALREDPGRLDGKEEPELDRIFVEIMERLDVVLSYTKLNRIRGVDAQATMSVLSAFSSLTIHTTQKQPSPMSLYRTYPKLMREWSKYAFESGYKHFEPQDTVSILFMLSTSYRDEEYSGVQTWQINRAWANTAQPIAKGIAARIEAQQTEFLRVLGPEHLTQLVISMQKFQVGSHSLLREIEKHILQSMDLFTSEEITHSLFSLNGSLSSYFLFNKWNGKENHPPGFFLALEFSQHFLNSQKTSPDFSAEQLGYIVLSLGDLYLKCNLSAHPGGQTVQSAMSSAAIKLLESDGILQLDLSRCIRGLSRGSASNAAIVSALCGATSKLLQPESKGGVGARSLEMFLHSVADISTAKGLKSIEERHGLFSLAAPHLHGQAHSWSPASSVQILRIFTSLELPLPELYEEIGNVLCSGLEGGETRWGRSLGNIVKLCSAAMNVCGRPVSSMLMFVKAHTVDGHHTVNVDEIGPVLKRLASLDRLGSMHFAEVVEAKLLLQLDPLSGLGNVESSFEEWVDPILAACQMFAGASMPAPRLMSKVEQWATPFLPRLSPHHIVSLVRAISNTGSFAPRFLNNLVEQMCLLQRRDRSGTAFDVDDLQAVAVDLAGSMKLGVGPTPSFASTVFDMVEMQLWRLEGLSGARVYSDMQANRMLVGFLWAFSRMGMRPDGYRQTGDPMFDRLWINIVRLGLSHLSDEDILRLSEAVRTGYSGYAAQVAKGPVLLVRLPKAVLAKKFLKRRDQILSLADALHALKLECESRPPSAEFLVNENRLLQLQAAVKELKATACALDILALE